MIEKFINENLPQIDDVDNIPSSFETFMNEERQLELKQLSQEENLSPDKLNKVISNFIFTERKPLNDDVIDILEVKPKILQPKSIVQRITDKIVDFVETFVNGMEIK